MIPIPSKAPFPLHVACSTGKRKVVKEIVDSVPIRVLEIKDEYGRTPLILCIAHNQTECAILLLKAGVHVNNSDSKGQTALHIAVHKGFHRSVKLLLSYNAYCLHKDFFGATPLHIAAIQTNTKCLNLLLKETKPGEVDIQDNSKKTALHWSTSYSNIENTKVLLIKGSNICIPDVEGKTPLHWAAISSKPEALDCVKILLDKERSLINWQDYEGRTALHLAVATGSTEVVRFIVCREDCDVDVPDNSFCTPLHWAAKRGLYDKVDVLLNGRACYTSVDGKRASPLHYAAFKNYAKTVEVFLSRNYVSERDVKDEDGRSAFIWAAAENADDVVNVMAANCLNLVDGDPNKITALHAAAIQGHVSTVELLLKLKVPIDLKDKYGMTSLLRACEVGRSKTALILLKNGADIHITDVNKRTALHWCALGGHAYLCQVLLQKGAISSAQDIFWMTPLHYACMKNGYLNCVSVLLESGAEPNSVDIEGKTPLHWAVTSNHQGVVRLLCEYDANVNALALKISWATPLDLAATKKGDNVEITELLKEYGALRLKEIEEIAASKIQAFYHSYKLRGKSCFSYENVFNRKENMLSNTGVLKRCQEIIDNCKVSPITSEDISSKFVPSIHLVDENIDSFSQMLQSEYFKNLNPELCMKSNQNAEINKNLESKANPFIQNVRSETKDQISNSAILRKCQQSIEMFQAQQSTYQTSNFFACLGTLDENINDFSLIYKNNDTKRQNLNKSSNADINVNAKSKAATVIQKAWQKHALKMRFKRMRRNIQSTFKTAEERTQAEVLLHLKLHTFYNQWHCHEMLHLQGQLEFDQKKDDETKWLFNLIMDMGTRMASMRGKELSRVHQNTLTKSFIVPIATKLHKSLEVIRDLRSELSKIGEIMRDTSIDNEGSHHKLTPREHINLLKMENQHILTKLQREKEFNDQLNSEKDDRLVEYSNLFSNLTKFYESCRENAEKNFEQRYKENAINFQERIKDLKTSYKERMEESKKQYNDFLQTQDSRAKFEYEDKLSRAQKLLEDKIYVSNQQTEAMIQELKENHKKELAISQNIIHELQSSIDQLKVSVDNTNQGNPLVPMLLQPVVNTNEALNNVHTRSQEYVLIVKPTSKSISDATKQCIVKAIDSRALNIRIQNIRPISEGGIIISTNTEEDLEKLRNELDRIRDSLEAFTWRTSKRIQPGL